MSETTGQGSTAPEPEGGYFKKESEGKVGSIFTVEDARRAHHLATADPEVDGLMTGPAHEAKYGLERAKASAAIWRAHGVHPTENRALVGDEDGAENLRGYGNTADALNVRSGQFETATADGAPENASAARASDPAV
jgi:hypothetical protein